MFDSFARLFGRDPAPEPTERTASASAPVRRDFDPRVRPAPDRLLADVPTFPSVAQAYGRQNWTRLRALSLNLYRTSAELRRYVDAAVSAIVGPTGVGLQSRAATDTGREAIESAWSDWCRAEYCDVGGRSSFVDVLRQAVASVIVHGEALIRIYRGPGFGPYGVQLQVLDPGRLDPEVNRELRDGAVIAEGIERDRHGRPVAYHLRKRTNDLAPVGVIQTRDVERVEAADVIHWFRRDEPEQTRGIPWAAPVASLIRHLDKYREAAVVAARTGAASMGFLESEDGDEADGELPVEIDPGSMIQLPPGFKFSAFDPGYPDGEFGEFVRATLRGIAAGLGVSYATLAGDLSDVNYSSIRQGALDERDTWRTHQDRLIAEVVQPVFDAWLEAALLAGAIKANGTPFKLGSRSLLEPVTWTPRRWQWVDPVKETAANVSAIQAGLKSPSEVVREQGRDLTEVAEEIKRDLAILREAGVDPFGGER